MILFKEDNSDLLLSVFPVFLLLRFYSTCPSYLLTLFRVKASHTITFPSWREEQFKPQKYLSVNSVCSHTGAEQRGDRGVYLGGADHTTFVFTPVHAQNLVCVTFQNPSGLYGERTQYFDLLSYLMHYTHKYIQISFNRKIIKFINNCSRQDQNEPVGGSD